MEKPLNYLFVDTDKDATEIPYPTSQLLLVLFLQKFCYFIF